MTKEEKKKEEKKKKEVKKVVKKAIKKPSDKAAKKVVNPVRGLPSAISSATPLATVISNGVKKTPIVKKPIKKVVKKISKSVVKKLVEEVKKEDKRIIEKPIIEYRKKEIGTFPVIKQKSDKEYYQGIGRRKRAVASARLFLQGDKIFTINNKPADIYFNNVECQKIIYEGLEKMNLVNKFKVEVLVRGGGLHAQAEAIRHGISRALLNFDETFREKLKTTGFLTRDPRRRERKKPGLKRARKATQWRKR